MSEMITINSWNVNGIRAVYTKGFLDWITKENADIVCIQETKARYEQLPPELKTICDAQNKPYYQYYAEAKRPGYSGTALFSKEKPIEVTYGIGIPHYDKEGRNITAHFNNYTIISVYFPSGTSGDVRQEIKMAWLDDFLNYLNGLKSSHPNIIVSGDFNICHKPIDINHPEKHETYSGFLPEERAWMDKFIDSGFVDTFRVFNNLPNQYSWWSYRAGSRQKNLGWRIDYHMVTESLKNKLVSASILADIVHSDHCPVKLEIDL